MKTKQTILGRVFAAFIGFGLIMGGIFPVYANFFVEWKQGLFLWFAVGCVIAGIVLGIINFFLLKLILLRPLNRLAEVAEYISKKDLRKRCEVESGDTIGSIVNSFNLMADELSGIVKRISNSAHNVVDVAQSLSDTNQTTVADIELQHESIKKISISIDQTAAAMQNVFESCEKALKSADLTAKEAENGKDIVSTTNDAVINLANSVSSTSKIIEGLSSNVGKISAVLDVIYGISKQTNLLALNAAIESSRAGEQGRGFAVVADEVRVLANRSQQSAQEISKMIENLRSSAADAVKAMELGSVQANAASEAIVNTVNSFENISLGVSEISNLNRSISKSIEVEQQESAGINAQIEQIVKTSEQITECSNESVSSTEKVNHLSEALKAFVSEFKM